MLLSASPYTWPKRCLSGPSDCNILEGSPSNFLNLRVARGEGDRVEFPESPEDDAIKGHVTAFVEGGQGSRIDRGSFVDR